MALQRQTIPQPFVGGIDTKTDPKMVRHPSLLKLENGTVEDQGRIKKRNGYSSIGQIDDGRALMVHEGGLLAASATKLHGYNSSSDSFAELGAYVSPEVIAEQVSSPNDEHTSQSSAHCDTVRVVAWADGGDAYISIYDIDSGLPVRTNIPVYGGMDEIRAFGLDSNVLLVVRSGDRMNVASVTASTTAGNIRWVQVLTSSVSIQSWAGCVAQMSSNVGPWVPPGSTADFVKYLVLAVTSRTLGYNCEMTAIDSTGAEADIGSGWDWGSRDLASFWSSVFGLVAPADVYVRHMTQIPVDSGHFQAGALLLSVSDGTQEGLWMFPSASTVSFVAGHRAWILATDAGSNIRFGSYEGGSGDQNSDMYYYYRAETSTYRTGEHQLVRYTFSEAVADTSSPVAVTTPAETYLVHPAMTPRTEPFRLNNEDYFVCTSASADFPKYQGAYYLISTGQRVGSNAHEDVERSPIHAHFFYTRLEIGSLDSDRPYAVEVIGDKAYFASSVTQRVKKVGIGSSTGTPEFANIDYYSGTALVTLDFASTAKHGFDSLGNNTHFAGGLVTNFDGAEFAEHGFFSYPGNSSALAASAAATPPAGTYLFKFLYEWVDARGQIHRSAPSQAHTVTTSGGNLGVTVTIQKPFVTNRLMDGRLKVVTYRTTVGGSDIFYRVRADSVFDGLAATTISFQVTDTDASITTNETLYTAGGELDNDPPPCSSLIAAVKNRLWCVDEWGDLWFSKEWRRGEAVGFSAFLQKQVPKNGGRIKAIGGMDDKVVIFKEDRIFLISGDGPQPNGENDTFSIAYELPAKVGCVNPKSLIETDDGLMMQTQKGIYLLSRGGQAVYIGQGVHAYNDLTITAAIALPDKNQVRFVTSDGPTLVYDYEQRSQNGVGSWSTFTNLESEGAVVYDGRITLLRNSGAVWQESDGYLDVGSYIELRVQTGWMAFAGLQGWKRVYRILLLGEKKSDHTLNMSFAYNYEDTEHQYVTFDTTALDAETFGDSSPFGVGAFGGAGDGDIYQFRVGPSRQQCTSIRVTVWDSGQSGTGESMTLTDLSAELGGIFGSTRLSSGRSG